MIPFHPENLESQLKQLEQRIADLQASLRSDANRAVLDYWCSLRGQDSLPRKSDFEPSAITRYLPHLILMDVQHEPLDFRYRLIGGFARHRLQQDMTGKWFREIPHKAAPSRIHSAFAKVVYSGRPRSTRVPYVGPLADFSEVEDLVLPLVNGEGAVDFLLISIDGFGIGNDEPQPR